MSISRQDGKRGKMIYVWGYVRWLGLFLTALLLPYIIHAEPANNTKLSEVYHIPLRVHLQESGLRGVTLSNVLEEIVLIWRRQAGICFDIETTLDNKPLIGGLDLWFHQHISEWNGYYVDEHNIHVRDFPDLGGANLPAKNSGARTAAHELGHALGLQHRQDSDDNLMRSKTYGWQLNEREVNLARNNGRDNFSEFGTSVECLPPRILLP